MRAGDGEKKTTTTRGEDELKEGPQRQRETAEAGGVPA